MATILRKSQFTDNGEGTFSKTGRIQPKTAGGAASKIESGSVSYTSSNENVATVEKLDEDENRFRIKWVGAGDVQIQVTGDADLDEGETKTVSGTLDLKLEEDEADTIEVILDEVA